MERKGFINEVLYKKTQLIDISNDFGFKGLYSQCYLIVNPSTYSFEVFAGICHYIRNRYCSPFFPSGWRIGFKSHYGWRICSFFVHRQKT